MSSTQPSRDQAVNAAGEPARPRHSQTLAFVSGMIPWLGPSEARVAEVVVTRVDEIGALSVADVAALAGTSTATVVRASQSLNFTGFNELRDVLQGEATVPEPVGAVGSLERTLAAGIEQLQSMAAMLDRDAFERAVTAVSDARRVLIATVADLGLLGQYAVSHLAMIGRSAESPLDAITQTTVAGQLTPEDVCIAVGRSGHNELTIRTAAAASSAGATVVAITSFPRAPLAEVADIHLVVGVSGPDPSSSVPHPLTRVRVGQMLVIDALVRALAERLDTNALTEALPDTVGHYTFTPPADRGP